MTLRRCSGIALRPAGALHPRSPCCSPPSCSSHGLFSGSWITEMDYAVFLKLPPASELTISSDQMYWTLSKRCCGGGGGGHTLKAGKLFLQWHSSAQWNGCEDVQLCWGSGHTGSPPPSGDCRLKGTTEPTWTLYTPQHSQMSHSDLVYELIPLLLLSSQMPYRVYTFLKMDKSTADSYIFRIEK